MKRHAVPATSEPVAPVDLSPAAIAEWERISGLLRERKSLDALDQHALHDYLTCWERVRECETDIQKRGVLVKGSRGALAKNPAIQIGRQYRESMLAWAKELGLTLGSRSRLAIPTPEPPKINPFLEFENENQ